ncbi:hypothetical protein COCMIDRAFT_38105 [Bipolaris oryzae ATCC 44560]|uniref:Uncharacterized protein n=1 Tax=Bipolaris oryzae ATCC 44560 TaxID=930090 RepID=W6Z2M2_COCMI|nr:uncharacterized protein COCMIDRAFT_38105 [Bipolaris oryzae ATCC 44560]EUC43978.1 hypothetical protein COCMIDRAFT_38105 [Bipolaris oryzae ATCC 44560]
MRFIIAFLKYPRRSLFKRYSRVSDEDFGLEFGEKHYKTTSHTNVGSEKRFRIWVALAWFFALTSAELIFNNWELRNDNDFRTCGGRFDTEFLPATQAIKFIKTRLPSSPRIGETGEKYFLPNSNIFASAGSPSPVVDKAWNISTGEIGESSDEYSDDRRGGYRTG